MKREELPRTHDPLTPEIVRHVEQLIADGFCDETAARLAGVTPFVVRMVRSRIENDAAEAAEAKARTRARAKSCAILNGDVKLRKLCRGAMRLEVIRRVAAAHPCLLRHDLMRICRVSNDVLIEALGKAGSGCHRRRD